MNILVINESHSIFLQQIELLGEFERYDLPENGATLEEVQNEIAPELAERNDAGDDIVFATPFAALMVELIKLGVPFGCLHNDRRVVKEVPDGKGRTKLVHVTPMDGWQLVRP